MTTATEYNAANCSGEPNSVPIRSAYFAGQGHVRVLLDVAQLQLVGLAVEQDGPVIAEQEPHGDAHRPPIGTHGRQPGHQVAAQPGLDMIATVRWQMLGEPHAVCASDG